MKTKLFTAGLLLVAGLAVAQTTPPPATKVTPVYSHDLSGIDGKEGLMLTVEYPPGGADPIHRHNANVFVHVLEGHITMQVKGRPPVNLGPGQTFYEGPDDIHVMGRNASKTKPAKFLVFFVKDKGTPPVLPAQ